VADAGGELVQCGHQDEARKALESFTCNN
jgi:hypothetical protein